MFESGRYSLQGPVLWAGWTDSSALLRSVEPRDKTRRVFRRRSQGEGDIERFARRGPGEGRPAWAVQGARRLASSSLGRLLAAITIVAAIVPVAGAQDEGRERGGEEREDGDAAADFAVLEPGEGGERRHGRFLRPEVVA